MDTSLRSLEIGKMAHGSTVAPVINRLATHGNAMNILCNLATLRQPLKNSQSLTTSISIIKRFDVRYTPSNLDMRNHLVVL